MSLSGSTLRLAIDGGAAELPEGPPGWPPLDEAVRVALNHGWRDGSWGRYHGGHVERLAEVLAETFAVDYAYPCSSGTFAVELALRALQIGRDDEVLLAGYDFPGNFRAIEAVGARPALVDVTAFNANLDLDQLDAACSPQTRAVIVSHLHGGVVPIDRVVAWAQRRGIQVVEDACQAHGASLAGQPLGSWGDVGVLSFGGSKLLSAGRGGALLTRRADVQQRAKIFCEQGNHAFPLSELQAMVLLPQLKSLDERHMQRKANVRQLHAALSGQAALRPFENHLPQADPAYYKLGLFYDGRRAGDRSRADFIAAAQAEGVAIDAGFLGFAQRSERRARRATALTQTAAASEQVLVLHHPVLLAESAVVDRVARALRKIIDAWSQPEGHA